jgi:hypothetical protein
MFQTHQPLLKSYIGVDGPGTGVSITLQHFSTGKNNGLMENVVVRPELPPMG